MNETEAEFVAIMMETGDWQPGSRMHRLALLARRGAEAAARIAQLEAALRVFTCDCTISERCAVPDNCCNFQARRTLEERT